MERSETIREEVVVEGALLMLEEERLVEIEQLTEKPLEPNQVFLIELLRILAAQSIDSLQLRLAEKLVHAVRGVEDGLIRGTSNASSVLTNLDREIEQRDQRGERRNELTDTSEILNRHVPPPSM